MTTTNNSAAKPLAYISPFDLAELRTAGSGGMSIDIGREKSPGRNCAIYDAEDYGSLLAEVKRLTENGHIGWELAAEHKAELDKATARAEAAESRLNKLIATIGRHGEWDDGCFYYNKFAAPELGSALNEEKANEGG